MGGSITSNLAGAFHIPRQARRAPAIAGAAAGLAAAFNTPLAAITFVLEEIVGDINSRTIGRVVLAAVVGAFTVYAFLGNQPAFPLPNVSAVTWWIYLVVPLAAATASLVGVAFQRGSLKLRTEWRTKSRVPRLYGPLVAGGIVWVLGISAFIITGKLGVFGLGYIDLSKVLTGQFSWKIAGFLVLAKLVATIVSYSLGGSGGIFSPLLFLGGMSGFFVAGFFGQWVPLTTSDIIVISAVGMSACLAVVLKTPLSALLIVFEMTHQFAMVPSLLIGLAVSMLVGKLTGPHNFYDSLLLQDGHELIRIHPPRDLTSWRNTSVRQMTLNRPVFAESLDGQTLEKFIETWPYMRFPVKMNGEIVGMVTRMDIQASIKENHPPRLFPAVFCSPDEKFRDVENRFLENPIGAILVRDSPESEATGILTLHDLIRLQASLED
jgi:CIC family chloride channel protein